MGVNTEQINDYIRHCTANGLSAERIASLEYNLRWYDRHLDKPFKDLTEPDLENLLLQLEKSPYTDWTKYTRKACLLTFMKWVLQDKHPKLMEGVKLRQPKDQLVKSDLLTYDELHKILNVTSENWRALYSVHYDGNFRRTEVLSAKIKDLITHEDYGELSYHLSKTRLGTKVLTLSMPYLLDWLEKHPYKDKPNMPLFMTYHKMWGRWVAITPRTYLQHLHRDAKKAELKKRVYTHLLRHSRTTQLITQKTPLAIVEKSGRWKPGSKSLQRYVHLGDEDYKNEMLAQAGITTKEQPKVPKLLTCPWCQTLNPPGQTRCKEPKCRRALDPWKQQEEEKKLLEEMRELLKQAKK